MPPDRTSVLRRRSLRAIRLTVIGIGSAALITILVVSLNRNAYFYYRTQDRTQWAYPAFSVLVVGMSIVVETAVTYAVFGLDIGRMWQRAFVGLTLLLPWALYTSAVFIHMPVFWLLHILWIWLVVACLAVGGVASAIMHSFAVIRHWRIRKSRAA